MRDAIISGQARLKLAKLGMSFLLRYYDTKLGRGVV